MKKYIFLLVILIVLIGVFLLTKHKEPKIAPVKEEKTMELPSRVMNTEDNGRDRMINPVKEEPTVIREKPLKGPQLN